MATSKQRVARAGSPAKKQFRRLVEFQGVRRWSLDRYQGRVRSLYDGPRGAVLALASVVSLHEPLVGHLLRSGQFDVSDCRSVLDVGSGAGQILKHLLRHAHPQAHVVAFDLSQRMLRRARHRLKSRRPTYVAGDLMHLPFADGAFDCVTCGWVIEHLPDPVPGLREIARVLRPGGRLLLLATEDTWSGALNSRTWKCRTYNRDELRRACETVGLPWNRQLWFTRVHRVLRMGGILVEAEKSVAALVPPKG